MSAVEQVLEDNRSYVERASLAGLSAPPRRKLAVLTCMDARLDPAAAFGLEPGDAHVIRNAGGRASDDALRSLAASVHLLGVETVLVVHHTSCGMAGSEESMREALASASGRDVGDLELLTFDDLEESVREDVARLRDWPLLPSTLDVHGFVFDVATGALDPVGS